MRTLIPPAAIAAVRAPRDGATYATAPTERRTAEVFRPAGPPRATVVLLHGWSDRAPRNYLQWIHHLTARDVAVVFPHYQDSVRSSRKQMLAGAEAGLRDGLELLGPDHGPLVLAGYSYGAGLAVIAAAESARWELPTPAAVYAVFPYFAGRSARTPLVVPHTTTVSIVVGDRDQVVGRRGAAAIERTIAPHPAALRVLESSPAMSFGHLSVLQTDQAAQAAFWTPLDRIVDRLAPR